MFVSLPIFWRSLAQWLNPSWTQCCSVARLKCSMSLACRGSMTESAKWDGFPAVQGLFVIAILSHEMKKEKEKGGGKKWTEAGWRQTRKVWSLARRKEKPWVLSHSNRSSLSVWEIKMADGHAALDMYSASFKRSHEVKKRKREKESRISWRGKS